MNDEILFDINDGIATITFNRPEALNTFTGDMVDGLGELYRRCDEDDEVKVVIVTGNGKAFCAGAEIAGDGDTFQTDNIMDFSSCPLSVQAWDVRKPVIAAVNGHAIGVGLSVAAQCDIRVLAAEGKYGFLQNRRGVVADFAIGHVLPRLIGFERAFEMIVRAPRISGTEAGEWGLASRVVPADQVMDTAMEIAGDMVVNCSPLVMGIHKRLMWKGQHMSREEYIELETRVLHHTINAPDAAEGGMAYFERRPPQWKSSVTKDWPEF